MISRKVLIVKLAELKFPGWDNFWSEVYRGGKLQVKNPDPNGKKPNVSAGYLIKKDEAFRKNVIEEYEDWASENGEKTKGPSKKKREKALGRVADKHFKSFGGLKSKGLDSKDFQEVSVSSLKKGLVDAFKEGLKASGVSNETKPDYNSIAKRVLKIPTLEVRGGDSKDFHEIGVSSLKKALEEAYDLAFR